MKTFVSAFVLTVIAAFPAWSATVTNKDGEPAVLVVVEGESRMEVAISAGGTESIHHDAERRPPRSAGRRNHRDRQRVGRREVIAGPLRTLSPGQPAFGNGNAEYWDMQEALEQRRKAV
jgi:hypothetical protein